MTVPQLEEETRFLSSRVLFSSETKSKNTDLQKVQKVVGFKNLVTVEGVGTWKGRKISNDVDGRGESDRNFKHCFHN